MHRTQILLEDQTYRRALKEAQARGESLGALVRAALDEYLGKLQRERAGDPLLDDPFDDPRPDPDLSRDVDHYLYGAPRRSRVRR